MQKILIIHGIDYKLENLKQMLIIKNIIISLKFLISDYDK